MKKVFLCEYIHPDAYAFLKAHAEVIREWDRLPEAEALINRNLNISDEVIERATSLRVIGIHGTGVDDVDMESAKKHGIQVFSVPHLNSRSVAEMNVALMLALGRKIVQADRRLTEGAPVRMAELRGMEMCGKVLGLMYAYSIAEVLKKADVVVIGVALTPETRQLMGKEQFEQMKSNAILINTTRGAVLDEQALYESLDGGIIAGAACDVFVDEPVDVGHPLLTLDNFIATPHLGANTEEALKRVSMAVVQGVLKRLNTQR